MTNNIALSGAMRDNLLSLVSAQRDIDTIQGRLATGRKVNSALDDPRNFFAAQSLNNRAGDLNRLLDSMGQSISTIKEADNGVSSLSSLLEQADSLAIQAKEELTKAAGDAVLGGDKDIADVGDLTSIDGIDNGGTFTIDVGGTSASFDIATGNSAESLVAAINDDATLEGLVKASFTASGELQIKAEDADTAVRIEDVDLGAAGLEALGFGNVTGTEAGNGTPVEAGTVVAGTKLISATSSEDNASALLEDAGLVTVGASTARVTLTVDGITSENIDVDATTTIQGFIDAVNTDANLDGALTASFNTDTKQIELESNGAGSVKFGVEAVGAGVTSAFGFGAGATDSAVSDTEAVSEFISFGSSSAAVGRLESDFNEIRNQIDALVNDASYRGVNLLKGDNLETVFNEDRTNKLTTEGSNFTSSGLGIGEADFSSSTSVQVSLDQLLSATTEVRDFGSSIANDLAVIQTRQDFTEKTINTLEEGSDKLTLADPNEEGAKLLALQTRQQLSITALSLASQSQSAVLSLF